MSSKRYADQFPYWKSGGSSPEAWVDKACREVERAGGRVVLEMFAQNSAQMQAGYLLQFQLEGDGFRIQWPVLQPRQAKDLPAARRQAATMLYHDVKTRCVSARVLGARRAFFGFLVLPDGRTAAECAAGELKALPAVLRTQARLLPEGAT